MTASSETQHVEPLRPTQPAIVQPQAVDELVSLRDRKFEDPLAHLQRLLSQPRRAFLLGAGCGKCAGLPLTSELSPRVLDKLADDAETRSILEAIKQNFDGSQAANIEDYLSELVDHISIAERRKDKSATSSDIIIGGQTHTLDLVRQTLAKLKDCIAACIKACQTELATHRKFVRTVHTTLEAGKGGPPRLSDYFVLNYDMLFEDALSLEQIPYADGFVGGATGWWNADTYKEVAVLARVFKLHGSLDWCLWNSEVFPRRVRDGLPTSEKSEPVLIWPAATKYRETQRDPYAQLLNFMRSALRPSSGGEVVLTICGYAFADTHINVEIDRALRESEQRLTVVALSSDDEPKGVLQGWLSDVALRDQVRAYCNRGFHHGTDKITAEGSLPWWKFEVLTRLLRGER